MTIAYQNSQNASGNPITNMTFSGTTIAPGGLLVIEVFSTGSFTAGFTDSINTGAYSSFTQGTDGARTTQIFYIAVNASGSNPVILATGLGSVSSTWTAAYYNGFVGTPTGVDNITPVVHYGSTTTALASTSFNTSHASELVCAFGETSNGSNSFVSGPSGWTGRGTFNASAFLYDQSVPTAGTATQFAGTLTSADFFTVATGGFYDNVAAGTPFMGQICL